MRRATLIAFLLTLVLPLLHAQYWGAKDLNGLEIYPIGNESDNIKKVAASIGSLFVAFRYGGVTYRDGSGKYINALEMAYVFAEKNGVRTVLCKIEKSRILDAYGEVLFDVARDDPQLYPEVVGVSSSLIDSPTHVSLVAKLDTQASTPSYYETEELMALTIDVGRKTFAKLNIR